MRIQCQGPFNYWTPLRRVILLFKHTEKSPQPGHVTDTKSAPDITVAPEVYWFDDRTSNKGDTPEKKLNVPWPVMSLVGEKASSIGDHGLVPQMQHAASYLDLLLLARPDLRGAFGLFISSDLITILFGIGGAGTLEFSFRWSSPCLPKAMVAMVYRLYHPDTWKDPSITRFYNSQTRSCTYSITFSRCLRSDGSEGLPRDAQVECEDFTLKSAQSSFGTRGHVFVHGASIPTFDGKPIRVVKSQLVRKRPGGYEPDILRRIHMPDVTLGVVRMACYQYHDSPVSKRCHVLIGLEQEGLSFMHIQTPQDLLIVLYNILEITRFLHDGFGILHRDLSKGNIMYIPRRAPERDGPPPATQLAIYTWTGCCRQPPSAPPTETSMPEAETSTDPVPPTLRKYAFVKSSLDDDEPMALLIDFNHATVVDATRSVSSDTPTEIAVEFLISISLHTRSNIASQGTPIFMARAIQARKQLAFETAIFPSIPALDSMLDNDLRDRVERFAPCQDQFSFPTDHKGDPSYGVPSTWRHELYHDAESVFWLLFYWIFFAVPSTHEEDPEPASFATWVSLSTNHADSRTQLVYSIPRTLCHPGYEGLRSLLISLASYLKVDLYWLDEHNPRRDPEYIHECFQRTIFAFLKENWNKPFMVTKKSSVDRRVDGQPHGPDVSSSTPEITWVASKLPPLNFGKRKSAQPTAANKHPGRPHKKLRALVSVRDETAIVPSSNASDKSSPEPPSVA
ncbi:hypothetical protein ONZ45_g6726 [Pleurotus djamor]|nr:hypothetical protein ONZ45_g6726 [Pleurotus djamor]